MRTPSLARRLVKQALARMGYTLVPNARYAVVPRDFNSPLSDVERLDDGFWDTPRSMQGLDLAIEEAIELLTERLAPYIGEFERPADRPDVRRRRGRLGVRRYSRLRPERSRQCV